MTNGTPNLADKFIMGTTSQATMNSTGGSNTTTLTATELPAHTHPVDITSGNHSHTIATSGTSGAGGTVMEANNTSATANTGFSTVRIQGDTGTTGSGAAYDSRPAYYALAFIMKS